MRAADREPGLAPYLGIGVAKPQEESAVRVAVEFGGTPLQGRKVRAFFAGGNGGQIFMGIPALDLVIGFTGGNYSDPALFSPQRVFVPQFILPAVN